MSNFDTNPGGRSASEIEREVDQSRDRVSGTIDDLQDRMSVGNLFQDVVSAFGKHGGDVGRNLSETVKNNPMPVILTGVGLAWLMAGSKDAPARRRTRVYDDDDFEMPRERPGPPPSVGAAPDSRGPRPVASGAGAPPPDRHVVTPTGPAGSGATARSSGGSVGGTDEGGKSGSLTKSAKDAASGAADSARGAADNVRDSAGRARDRVSDSAGRARDAAADGYDRAADSVGRAGDDLRYRAGRARDGMERGGRRVQDEFGRMLDEQPLVLGGLALAIGAAIGGALPRTRREDEAFGAESDHAWDVARDEAFEQADKAKAVGLRVADEATKMADEAAGDADSKTPGGREAVEKAESAARDASGRLKDAAKDEAGKQKLGEPAGSKPTDGPGKAKT